MKGGIDMKILIVGYFNETAKSNITAYFPQDWNVGID